MAGMSNGLEDLPLTSLASEQDEVLDSDYEDYHYRLGCSPLSETLVSSSDEDIQHILSDNDSENDDKDDNIEIVGTSASDNSVCTPAPPKVVRPRHVHMLSSSDDDDDNIPLSCLADDRPPSDVEEVVLSDPTDHAEADNLDKEKIDLLDDDDGADVVPEQTVKAVDPPDVQVAKSDVVKKDEAKTKTKVKSAKKRKKKTKPEDGTKKLPEGEDGSTKKKKRKKSKKRKAEQDAEDEDDEAKKKRKTTFERRNIRKIFTDDKVDSVTLNAQKEEMERMQRLKDLREKLATQQMELEMQEKERLERIAHSELKSLLEAEGEEEEEEEIMSFPPPDQLLQPKDEKMEASETVPSRDQEIPKEAAKVEPKEKDEDSDDVIELSSDEDDIVMLPSDQEEEEEEDDDDPSNSGCHVNDALNQPDMYQRVMVNMGHPPDEKDIFLAPQLARQVKPHQIGGIRFLYDNLVESTERFGKSEGFGCILAHSMGLGKTIQVISFVETFLRTTSAKTVLIIVPVNTLQNWLAEFNKWLPPENPPEKPAPPPTKPAKSKSKSRSRNKNKNKSGDSNTSKPSDSGNDKTTDGTTSNASDSGAGNTVNGSSYLATDVAPGNCGLGMGGNSCPPGGDPYNFGTMEDTFGNNSSEGNVSNHGNPSASCGPFSSANITGRTCGAGDASHHGNNSFRDPWENSEDTFGSNCTPGFVGTSGMGNYGFDSGHGPTGNPSNVGHSWPNMNAPNSTGFSSRTDNVPPGLEFRPHSGTRPDGMATGFGSQPDGNRPDGMATGFGSQPDGNRPDGMATGFGSQPDGNRPDGMATGFGSQQDGTRPDGMATGFGSQQDGTRPDGRFGNQPDYNRPDGSRPDGMATGFGSQQDGTRPDGITGFGSQQDGTRPDGRFGNQPDYNRPAGSRPDGMTGFGSQPDGRFGNQPDYNRPAGSRPDGMATGLGSQPDGNRPDGMTTGFGSQPYGNRPDGMTTGFGSQPYGTRSDQISSGFGSWPQSDGKGLDGRKSDFGSQEDPPIAATAYRPDVALPRVDSCSELSRQTCGENAMEVNSAHRSSKISEKARTNTPASSSNSDIDGGTKLSGQENPTPGNVSPKEAMSSSTNSTVDNQVCSISGELNTENNTTKFTENSDKNNLVHCNSESGQGGEISVEKNTIETSKGNSSSAMDKVINSKQNMDETTPDDDTSKPKSSETSTSENSLSGDTSAAASNPEASSSTNSGDALCDSMKAFQEATEALEKLTADIWPRTFPLHILNDTHRTTHSRAKIVDEWQQKGGVLLMGYEMYRLMTSKRAMVAKPKRSRKPAPKEDMVIDVEEEDRNKEIMGDIHGSLMSPGPDLIICDEGHRIKNSHASISQALKKIRTKRRVVLTGYPLQNNLIEYWCMVDFVRPNFLGTRTEFSNMFERPIMNGQCMDSTAQDLKLMRFRAHVLHSLLEGFVQRRGHAVLKMALPPKEEYVLLVRLSPIQRKLYNLFMETVEDPNMETWANSNPIKAFSVCCKIWNHPDILYQLTKQRKGDDFDLDLDPEGEPRKTKRRGKAGEGRAAGKPPPQPAEGSTSQPTPPAEDGASQPLPPAEDGSILPVDKKEPVITYEWADELMESYMPGVIEHSGKMLLLLSLIEEAIRFGDKILVFSQSLFTLTLIEDYLGRQKVPVADSTENWTKNKSYFRLDGSTSASEREKLIREFNDPKNTQAHLFLLSTRAGCLGINLIGANRVVVFDASWNPCHDCQAVCRVYRYGQTKPTYVYRLVTDNTMERKIYDRQINKQGISDRVVDEAEVQNNFSRKQVDVLMHYVDQDMPKIDPKCLENVVDPVLKIVLQKNHEWITKDPFRHESLLIDQKDKKLTKKEKRLAKESYEMEKKMNISYSRPSYAAYYPKGMGPMNMNHRPMLPNSRFSTTISMVGGRPVASVRPMMSTPIPLHARGAMGSAHMRPAGGAALPVNSLLKPGVSVHQVQTTTDIMIPGSATATNSQGSKIPAGENVMVIKTPKGVYIRTNQGKIFAVRSGPTKPGTASSTGSTGGVSLLNSAGAVSSAATTATVSLVNSTNSPIMSNLRAMSGGTVQFKKQQNTSGIIVVSRMPPKPGEAAQPQKIKVVTPSGLLPKSLPAGDVKHSMKPIVTDLGGGKKVVKFVVGSGSNTVQLAKTLSDLKGTIISTTPKTNSSSVTNTVASTKVSMSNIVPLVSSRGDNASSSEAKDKVKSNPRLDKLLTTGVVDTGDISSLSGHENASSNDEIETSKPASPKISIRPNIQKENDEDSVCRNSPMNIGVDNQAMPSLDSATLESGSTGLSLGDDLIMPTLEPNKNIPSPQNSSLSSPPNLNPPSPQNLGVPGQQHLNARSQQDSLKPSQQHLNVPTGKSPSVPGKQPLKVPTQPHSNVPHQKLSHVPSQQNVNVPGKQDLKVPSQLPSDAPIQQNSTVPSKQDLKVSSQQHSSAPSKQALKVDSQLNHSKIPSQQNPSISSQQNSNITNLQKPSFSDPQNSYVASQSQRPPIESPPKQLKQSSKGVKQSKPKTVKADTPKRAPSNKSTGKNSKKPVKSKCTEDSLQQQGHSGQHTGYAVPEQANPVQPVGYPLQQQQGNPVQPAGYPVEQQMNSVQHTGYPVEHQNSSTQHTGYPADQQRNSVQHTGYPVEQQSSSTQHTRYPVEQQNSSTQHTGYPVEQQSGSTQHTGYPVEQQSSSAQHTGYPVEQQSSSTQHTGYPVEQQNSSAHHSGYPVEQQNSSTQHSGYPVGQQSSSAQHSGYPVQHQGSSVHDAWMGSMGGQSQDNDFNISMRDNLNMGQQGSDRQRTRLPEAMQPSGMIPKDSRVDFNHVQDSSGSDSPDISIVGEKIGAPAVGSSMPWHSGGHYSSAFSNNPFMPPGLESNQAQASMPGNYHHPGYSLPPHQMAPWYPNMMWNPGMMPMSQYGDTYNQYSRHGSKSQSKNSELPPNQMGDSSLTASSQPSQDNQFGQISAMDSQLEGFHGDWQNHNRSRGHHSPNPTSASYSSGAPSAHYSMAPNMYGAYPYSGYSPYVSQHMYPVPAAHTSQHYMPYQTYPSAMNLSSGGMMPSNAHSHPSAGIEESRRRETKQHSS